MKRSKMVKIIQMSIERYFDYSPYADNMKGAEFVLEQIEKCGMLPPTIVGEYDSVPTVTPTGNLDYSFKREWEPE